MPERPRLALLAPLPPEAITSQHPGIDVAVPDPDAVSACRGADLVVTDWSGHHRLTAAAVDVLAPGCRLVQVPASGLDAVDVDAVHAAGIPLASGSGLNADAVAEWCVWAVLDGLRGFSASDRGVRAGAWPQLGPVRHELGGRTVGIVGFGAVGTAVARRLRSFDVDLRYVARHRRRPADERELGVRWTPLADLLPAAHVLVLACALDETTRGLLDADAVARLPAGAVVVNASRGEVTDEAALAAAVRAGRLHAVVTDVYTTEPVPADHPLRGLDAVTTTPHVAGVSAEAVGRLLVRVFTNLEAALEGRPLEGLVHPR